MPSTLHVKKGWLPEFSGYTREQEQELSDFAKVELEGLLNHKKEARFFSQSLMFLADPEFEPDTPTPRRKRKTRRPVQLPQPQQASPPRQPQECSERPAPESSPLSEQHAHRPQPRPEICRSLGDFAGFWNEDD